MNKINIQLQAAVNCSSGKGSAEGKRLGFYKVYSLRGVLLLMILGFNMVFVAAQEYTYIKGFNNQVMYLNMRNPLNLSFSKIHLKNIEVVADQGNIIRNNNYFDFVPNKLGVALVTTYKRIRNKRVKLEQNKFLVKEFPLPFAKVAYYKNQDTVFKSIMLNQKGVRADIDYFACTSGLELIVSEFTTIILRNNLVVFTEATKGNLFSESTLAAFANLQNNDKVIFASIIAHSSIKNFSLNPVEYTIKE